MDSPEGIRVKSFKTPTVKKKLSSVLFILTANGVGPGTTLAWPGWKQPDIPVEVDMVRLETSRTEAGV